MSTYTHYYQSKSKVNKLIGKLQTLKDGQSTYSIMGAERKNGLKDISKKLKDRKHLAQA